VQYPSLQNSDVAAIFQAQTLEGYWLLYDLELIGLDGKKVEELLLKAGAKSLGMLNVTQ
jgi:hypothetical protein